MEYRIASQLRHILREIPQALPLGYLHGSFVGFHMPGQDFEKGGLPRSVLPHQPRAGAIGKEHGDAVKEEPLSEAKSEIAYLNHALSLRSDVLFWGDHLGSPAFSKLCQRGLPEKAYHLRHHREGNLFRSLGIYGNSHGLVDPVQMLRSHPLLQELLPDGTDFVSGADHPHIPGGCFFQKSYCLRIQGMSPGGDEDEAVSVKSEPLGKDLLQGAAKTCGLGSTLFRKGGELFPVVPEDPPPSEKTGGFENRLSHVPSSENYHLRGGGQALQKDRHVSPADGPFFGGLPIVQVNIHKKRFGALRKQLPGLLKNPVFPYAAPPRFP